MFNKVLFSFPPQHPKFNRYETLALSGVKKMETDPSVFNFYVYLRTHPLITRHALAQNAQKKGAIMLTGFRGAKSIDQVGSTNGRIILNPSLRKGYSNYFISLKGLK